MAKVKTKYSCTECGYTTPRWMGKCPECQSWNSFVEETETPAKSKEENHRAKLPSKSFAKSEPLTLDKIPEDDTFRSTTGMPELDRVLGGGLVKGSFVLLGGDPGVGKSTLALQVGQLNSEKNILYCSGEESAAQIRQRAKRMNIVNPGLHIFAETDMNRILQAVEKLNPDLLIVDSIQTVFRPEHASMPGTVAQIRESAALLMKLAKQTGLTTIVIGHVTKEGDLAGPRVLEHMVDVVLQFEGDKQLNYRLLRSVKNRFGRTHEIGVFEMLSDGLRNVSNPSELFLSGLTEGVSGNAAACIMEGNRPIILEIQALVTPANYGTPQRTSSGFDQRRLSLLLAVLEKRAGFQFGKQDVFLNVAGGIRLSDTASDLAVICALVSAYTDKPLPPKTLMIGEVGLGAELRSVTAPESRIREAEKAGFEKIYIPGKSGKSGGAAIACNSINDVFRQVFRRDK